MTSQLATVGILSIGDMGMGIAKLLVANNYRVVTNASDRSQDTQKRARSASVDLVLTDESLVQESDYILSIVPPRDARAIATRVRAGYQAALRPQEKPLYFLDLNAISPQTAQDIARDFSSYPITLRVLDGGIIGGPPKITNSSEAEPVWYKPSIVVSGHHALKHAPVSGSHLADLLNMKHVAQEIGPASGLKMCFAAMNKGFAAIAIESFTTAEAMGVLPELQSHLKEFNPKMAAAAEGGLVGMPPKAYRWVAEMEEIAYTMERFGGFSARGMQRDIRHEPNERSREKDTFGRGGDLFRGVSDVFKFIAEETELGKEKTERREIGRTAEDVAKECVKAMAIQSSSDN